MIDPWTAIEKADQKRLTQLFADDPDRLARFTLEEAGIYFDWSKTHLTREIVQAFAALAETRDLAGKREALFSGEIVNPTEGRAAELARILLRDAGPLNREIDDLRDREKSDRDAHQGDPVPEK